MITTAWLPHSLATLALCCVTAAQAPTKKPSKQDPVVKVATVKVATIEAGTRAPSKQEASNLDLKFEVRTRGQIVTKVAKHGAAAKSGLVAGDIMISLGGVDLFSQDDIADVLRVSAPGQKLAATVLRSKTNKEEVVQITLGTREVKAKKTAELAWDYASLVNIDAALLKAKANNRLVLVGLSGAET